MAQVDIVNYWPILCWCIIFFFLYYIFNFCYLLPFIFQNLKIQVLFVSEHLQVLIAIYKFWKSIGYFKKICNILYIREIVLLVCNAKISLNLLKKLFI